MAADLFKGDQSFKSLIEFASQRTNQNLETLCLRGPARILMQARFLQPLIVAVSMGYLRHCIERGIKADVVLGHSLGEISALAAAGVVSPQQAVEIALKRGELMDSAASLVEGGMLAVVFMSIEGVRAILNELHEPDGIVIANDNAADQIILSGKISLLDEFAKIVADRKVGKTKRLDVAGPWHSPFMKSAQTEFASWIEAIPFNTPAIPIIFNAGGITETDPQKIKTIITNQLVSPVYWRACIQKTQSIGIDRLIEIGPGRVLSGLARVNGYTDRKAIYSVNNLRGLEILMSENSMN